MVTECFVVCQECSDRFYTKEGEIYCPDCRILFEAEKKLREISRAILSKLKVGSKKRDVFEKESAETMNKLAIFIQKRVRVEIRKALKAGEI